VSSPDSDKSWSKARLERVYANFQSDRPEQVANLVNPEIAKPLHQNSIARMAVVLAAAGVLAVIGWIAFNGKSKSPVAIDSPTPVTVEDATANSEGWKAAATQSTANGLPVDVPVKTTPTVTPTVKPTPAAPVVKKVPAPVVKTVPAPVVAAAPRPQIIYKTIYRTLPARSQPLPRPAPVAVVKTLPRPKTAPRPVVILAKAPTAPPPSFIPIAGGRRTSVAIRPTTVRVKRRQPLASENILLARTLANSTAKTATLIPGTTVTGRSISPLQSSSTAASSPGKPGVNLRVALDRPLPTAGGDRIPIGAIVTFAATIDPQNGAITAVSGDVWSNGKTISMPPGAIAIQAANDRPLIATSFKPRTGDLARADTNNALLGAVGQVGEELTKSTTSINVGNGSTIIQQTNNPNILGAVLKGGFQTWATDQRQRTQTEVSQINALQPIQYLAQGTPVTLTVARPARIIIPR
jgi:hypothetical protein